MIRIHEEVLHENGRRKGPSKKVEVGLQVGVAVGVVGAESLAGKVEPGCFVAEKKLIVGRLNKACYLCIPNVGGHEGVYDILR